MAGVKAYDDSQEDHHKQHGEDAEPLVYKQSLEGSSNLTKIHARPDVCALSDYS
jgi:hypothetical protein